MQRVLLFVVVLLAIVAALGFYMGWFHFGSETTDGSSKVSLIVDKEKFKNDEKNAVKKVEDVGHKVEEKILGVGSKTAEGKVVSVVGDKLTIADKDGKEVTHPLSATAAISCDGKACTRADLKAGMKIRVTYESTAAAVVTRIEALDVNSSY